MKNTQFEEDEFWLGEVIETLVYFKILSNGLDCTRLKFKWPVLNLCRRLFVRIVWVSACNAGQPSKGF